MVPYQLSSTDSIAQSRGAGGLCQLSRKLCVSFFEHLKLTMPKIASECMKEFSSKWNLDRHLQQDCKACEKIKDLERRNKELTDALVKSANDASSSPLLNILKEKDEALCVKDEQIAALNKELKTALKSARPSNVNITNNVTINVFGSESLDHIDPEAVLTLMRDRETSLPRFIKMVYDEPSNKTIRCVNISKPHYSVWTGNAFVSELKDSVHRKLYHTYKKRMLEMAGEYVSNQSKKRARGEAPQWGYPWDSVWNSFKNRHMSRFELIDKGIQHVDDGKRASDRKVEDYVSDQINSWKAMKMAIEMEVAAIVRPERIE